MKNDSDHSRITPYVIAVAGSPLAAALLAPLRDSAIAPALGIVLVLPVLLAALPGRRGPAVVAAFAGAASFDFFLTRPFRSLRIDDSDDLIVTAVLLLAGLVVAQLASERSRSERAAVASERDLESLRRFAGLGAGGEDLGWLIRAATRQMADLLVSPDVDYRPGAVPPGVMTLGHGKVTVPSRGAPVADGDHVVAVAVDHGGRHVAHFLVRYMTPVPGAVPIEGRAQAIAVAEMLGAAIARAPRISAN